MKRVQRIGALMEILSGSPNKVFSLSEFCSLFGAAKSSVSEDLAQAREITRLTGLGKIETISTAVLNNGKIVLPMVNMIELLKAQFEAEDAEEKKE